MLGFLPYACGVHYDTEKQRRPLLHSLIADGTLPDGYATDDGVNIHFVDTELHRAVSDTPLGRAGQPAKLAGAFVFLASQESSFVTGEVIGVTGGSFL